MLVNADFSNHAIVTPSDHRWLPSPQGGVERIMLDRIGQEKARATSLVRYAPNSCFPRHEHPGGEEILVLSGTFSDEDGHYPAGWYLRNPPGSHHQPFSQEGATIFVKLWQMTPEENRQVRIDTQDPARWKSLDSRQVCPLFSSDLEQVCLQRLSPGDAMFPDSTGGAELLVLSGEVTAWDRTCKEGSWMRLPLGRRQEVVAGPRGATLYLKTGHLADMTREAWASR